MAKEEIPSTRQLREWELYRRKFVNPQLDPTSSIFKAKLAEAKEAREGERLAKVREESDRVRKQREELLGAPLAVPDSKRQKM